MSENVAKHVIVSGRVQGVGFRAFVEDEAARHHLAGWVRNRRDGTVEAVFVGGLANVDVAIAACRRGPSLARVDGVIIRDATADDLAVSRPAGFAFLPTV
jgi:acylphosphatase